MWMLVPICTCSLAAPGLKREGKQRPHFGFLRHFVNQSFGLSLIAYRFQQEVAMRLRYHLAGPLFARCIVAYATSIGLNDLRIRTTTAADFASFGQGIGLSESTI